MEAAPAFLCAPPFRRSDEETSGDSRAPIEIEAVAMARPDVAYRMKSVVQFAM